MAGGSEQWEVGGEERRKVGGEGQIVQGLVGSKQKRDVN